MGIKQWAMWALLALAPCALGMTVEVRGNVIFASGPVEDDLPKFQSAFATPGVDTVALVNSPGGDLWTGLLIGRLIANKGLKTVVAGYCHSACSVIFIGGRERRFSGAFHTRLNVIGIHGAHDMHTKQIIPQVQAPIFAFYKQNIGERFNATVMNQALYEMDDMGALLRVFEPARNGDALPYHCRSGQSRRQDCTDIRGQDAMSLGLITHADLASLDLPPSLKAVTRLLGRELDHPIGQMADFLAALAVQGCRSEACKANIQTWAARGDHKVIASRLEGAGFGASWDRPTPNEALVGAIYRCNHPANAPAVLCEARALNGFDLEPMRLQTEAAHAQALGKLTPPKEKFYSNEEFGGGFTSAEGLRKQKLVDITPQKLTGVRTVTTQELSRMLKSAAAPVVIDVLGDSFEVIPGSTTLLKGGLALDAASDEAQYHTRFLSLLALLAPDKSKPIVFYCAGRNCWHAVNASLRAVLLGYTDVLWYRGGIESWLAAQLPTAPMRLRAVAH